MCAGGMAGGRKLAWYTFVDHSGLTNLSLLEMLFPGEINWQKFIGRDVRYSGYAYARF
jgi:hypothetical protein